MRQCFLAGLLMSTQIGLVFAQTSTQKPTPFDEVAADANAVVSVAQRIGTIESSDAKVTVTALIVDDPAGPTKLMKGVRIDMEDQGHTDRVYLGESQFDELLRNLARTWDRASRKKEPGGVMSCRRADSSLRILCPSYRIDADLSGLGLRVIKGHLFSLPGRVPSDLTKLIEQAATVMGVSLDVSQAQAPPDPKTNLGRIMFKSSGEVEPNDDTLTAYPVSFPTPVAPTDRVAITVRGSVNDLSDFADTISFTPLRTERFFFKLCESTCNSGGPTDKYRVADSLDVGVAYFDVLDTVGNVLISTKANKSNENHAALCLKNGETVNITVVARNTMNAAQEYKVYASEQPIPMLHGKTPIADTTKVACDPTRPTWVPKESYAVLIGAETTLSQSPANIDVGDASIVGSRTVVCLALGAGMPGGPSLGQYKADMDQYLGDATITVLVTEESGEQHEFCGPSARWTAKGDFAGANEVSACYLIGCGRVSLSSSTAIKAVTLSSSQPVTILGAFWHSHNRLDAQ